MHASPFLTLRGIFVIRQTNIVGEPSVKRTDIRQTDMIGKMMLG